MTIKQVLRALQARRNEMAKLRDSLRELTAEVADERDRVEDAMDSLEYCIDRLSETV